MYLDSFGLNELPFSIAPNPRYLYLTDQHQEALAHLTYGLGSAGGVILLTGEVGTGKTTISRKLLEDLPEHIDVAWIVNPRLSAEELLASVCDELSISYAANTSSIKVFTDLINAYLIEAHGQGRNVVLMIDEAQNLSPEVLEQLRLLTNLETSERKLLQIILLGQPELKAMLERTDLRQLAQRITARYHLHALSKAECSEYIRHRLSVAGCNRPVFSEKAINVLFDFSRGIPRLINLLCDRSLLGVYSCNESIVETVHVYQASKEVLSDHVAPPKQRLMIPLLMVPILVFSAAILLYKIGPTLLGGSVASPNVALQYVSIHEHQGLIAHDSTIAPLQDIPVHADLLVTTAASENEPFVPILMSVWEVMEAEGTKFRAFKTLANIWGYDVVDSEITPCNQLAEKKLFCMQKRANTWLLREYNRPALFQVLGNDGQKHYAVIRAVEGDQFVIQLNQQRWNISQSELKQHWKGKVTLFWVKPVGYKRHLKAGDTGQIVRWLARQMDVIQGAMIPPQTLTSMNDVLIERIKYFQKSESLPTDGLVGPLTFVRMNEYIDQNKPRLTDKLKPLKLPQSQKTNEKTHAKAMTEAKEKAEANAKVMTEARKMAEANAKAETLAKEKAEANVKAETLAKERAEADVKSETLAKEKAEANVKSMTAARKQAEANVKVMTEAMEKAKSKVKAEALAREKAEANAKAMIETREKAEANAKVMTEAMEKAKSKVKAEALAREKAEANAKAMTEAREKAEANVKVMAEARKKAEANLKAETLAKEKAEANAKAMITARKQAEANLKAETLAKEKAEANAKLMSKTKRDVSFPLGTEIVEHLLLDEIELKDAQ